MKPETVAMLCTPGSHEPLKYISETDQKGNQKDMLVSENKGERFDIIDGIPVFVDSSRVTGYNKKYQGFYNRIAGLYDGSIRFVAKLAGKNEEKFREEYLRELEIKEGDKVLEVSIGTGANLRYLPSNADFYGLDISRGMLKKCQKNMQKWNRTAELILGNAEELPFLNESFDSVFHVGGINAFNDRAKAISEMIRVAKPGTKIVIVDETLKTVESIKWIPGTKKVLREFGDRFRPPVDLVPKNMLNIQTKDIDKGIMYCLTFIKP